MLEINRANSSSYFPIVLETVIGLNHQLSLILAGTAATQYALTSMAPILYIDRFGRRRTMMIGSLGCSISMAVIAGGIRAGNEIGGAFAIAFMFLFDDMYALGIHAVAWMYASEINSLYVSNRWP